MTICPSCYMSTRRTLCTWIGQPSTICRVTAFQYWCPQLNSTQRHLRNSTRYFCSNSVVISYFWCARVRHFPGPAISSSCYFVVHHFLVLQIQRPQNGQKLPRVSAVKYEGVHVVISIFRNSLNVWDVKRSFIDQQNINFWQKHVASY